MKKTVALIIVTLVQINFIFAQEKYALQSEEYYIEKSKEYQNWLVEKGLDRYFNLVSSDTTDGHLTFLLGFGENSDDSARINWETAKSIFESNHEYTFEEWLYKSMISVVQLHPKFANIQAYTINSAGKRGKFYRAIYYDETTKEIKVLVRNGSTNFDPTKLLANTSALRSLNPTQMNMQGASKLKLDLKNVSKSKSVIFDEIADFSKNKYKLKVPNVAKDFYRDNSKTEILYFEVRNLRGEVFSEDENNFVADFISWFSTEKVDWRTLEELHYIVKYIPASDFKSFSLEFDIKGRYGSGFHGINEWEKMFDMEKDFDPKLERYQKAFANEIFEYLNNK